MSSLVRIIVVAGFLALVVALGACNREITTVTEVVTAQNCFDCHSDNNTFLVAAEQQWLRSVHASGENIDRNSGSCVVCHTSDGFVASVTGGSVPGVVDNPTPIHCFTCHAPHSNSDFRLRVTAAATLENGASFDLGAGNLCVSCHRARRNVDTYVRTANDTTIVTSSHWGPHHSVQGDMVIGSNGYEYAGFNYFITEHRSQISPVTLEANACLFCHKDVTKNLVLGGHSFNMSYVAEADTVLNTGACASCHGSMSDFNYAFVQDSVTVLLERLETLLIAGNLIDSSGHPVGSRNNPRVVAANDSAGAMWNYLMAEEDRSHGVHNRSYIEGLLRSSILFMQGALPTPTSDYAVELHESHSGQR